MQTYEIVITNQAGFSSPLEEKMNQILATQAQFSLRRDVNFLEMKIDGKTQGLAQVTLTLDYILLDNIWVHESLQKQGFGIRLYQAIEDFAKQKNCKKIFLQTFDFLNTLSFWQRFGFRCIGEVSDCPRGHTLFYLAKDLPCE